MLIQQLRQRSLQVITCPGRILVTPSYVQSQETRSGLSSEAGDLERQSPSGTTSAIPAVSAQHEAVSSARVVSDVERNDGTAITLPPKGSAQPSQATSAAMAKLRSRLAVTHTSPNEQTAARAAPSGQQPQLPVSAPFKPEVQPAVPIPERHQEAAEYLGLSLQLGEMGNPLQSMAVLTHENVRQMEEYSRDPLTADRRFLTSLQKMAPASQQRAAAIMQMAAGAVPAPAVLVWAAQEVMVQMRALLLERLKEGQQQQGGERAPGGLTALVSEPWYDGVLQLARLARGASPDVAATTDLQLLNSFAGDATGARGTTAAVVAPVPYVATWEGLLALPQLHSLLQAAVPRSPELAAVLDLARLRPAAEVTPGPPPPATEGAFGRGQQPERRAPAQVAESPEGMWLLPALRAAAAAGREKMLRTTAVGVVAAGNTPLDADEELTALRSNQPAASPTPPAETVSEDQQVAADRLAVTTLLNHVEKQLGCAGGVAGVRLDAIAALHLLDLPLEPRELPYLDELRVSEHELNSWISETSMQLAASRTQSPESPVPMPAALEARIAAARERLAVAGRALVLASSDRVNDPRLMAPKAAATQAWLRAVGAPLLSGLLSGGYASLVRLRSMVPELREALMLRLLETGKLQGGTAALTAALYGDVDAAWRGARASSSGAATAAALLREEAVSAELDLVHERYVATPPQLQEPLPLPSDAALASAVQALPPPARLLYDSYYVLHADAGSDAAVVQERRRVADALAAAGEGGVVQGLGDLQAWLAESRKRLLLLPAPLLALLLRFLRVQVAITPDHAQSQRNKLTALALLVAEQQRRAVVAAAGGGRTCSGADGGSNRTAAAAAEELAAVQELAKWSRSGKTEVAAGGRLSGSLSALLGPSGAMDFTSWLQATALQAARYSPREFTHQLLARQHLDMDVERYLMMTHDPRLHLPRSGLSPASSTPAANPTTVSWTHPALRRSEEAFLGEMRPQLDAYLRALGHRPLGDAEWCVYRDAALDEWEEGRQAREERLLAAGQSGFCNPRADEVYLQQMLEEGIHIDDPLGPQSRRYLDTLLRNPSWTFKQRHQAVQRLIQLNAHFASQPPAPEGGSPFAPFFAVGGPDVVPRLAPLDGAPGQEGGSEELASSPRGPAHSVPLALPRGF